MLSRVPACMTGAQSHTEPGRRCSILLNYPSERQGSWGINLQFPTLLGWGSLWGIHSLAVPLVPWSCQSGGQKMPQAKRPQSHDCVWELSAGVRKPQQHLQRLSNAYKRKTIVYKPLKEAARWAVWYNRQSLDFRIQVLGLNLFSATCQLGQWAREPLWTSLFV